MSLDGEESLLQLIGLGVSAFLPYLLKNIVVLATDSNVILVTTEIHQCT